MITSEAREQFEAVHLVGTLEAAVYDTLAAVPSHAWTSPELSLDLRADADLVDVVLRQFAAAGIVETLPTGPDLRYRWRSTLQFLGDQPAPDAVRDPVCGMWVHASTAIAFETATGTEFFCSHRCLARWQRNRMEGATSRHRLPRLPSKEGRMT